MQILIRKSKVPNYDVIAHKEVKVFLIKNISIIKIFVFPKPNHRYFNKLSFIYIYYQIFFFFR